MVFSFFLILLPNPDIDSVNLDDYNIHVIASVFKQWLRDLPNPLMTFELYEEFLRAMGKEPPLVSHSLSREKGWPNFLFVFGPKPASFAKLWLLCFKA